ncbi:TPA: hypothetical protein ACYLN4_000678 [Burkholderia lata]
MLTEKQREAIMDAALRIEAKGLAVDREMADTLRSILNNPVVATAAAPNAAASQEIAENTQEVAEPVAQPDEHAVLTASASQFTEKGSNVFAGFEAYDAGYRKGLARAPASHATLADVPLELVERLRKTMTRLGVYPGDGVEWFAANMERNLYTLDSAVNEMLDSISPQLVAEARKDAFNEAASVDAKVIAMLMAAGNVSREDVNEALAKVAALQERSDTQAAPKAGERAMYIFLKPGDVQLATDEVFSGDIYGWVRSSPAFVGHQYMDGMPLIRRAAGTLPDVSPPAAAILPPMPDPAELLEIARATGLRSFLHGVNATDAREILENYLIAVDGRRSTLPPGSPQAPGLSA